MDVAGILTELNTKVAEVSTLGMALLNRAGAGAKEMEALEAQARGLRGAIAELQRAEAEHQRTCEAKRVETQRLMAQYDADLVAGVEAYRQKQALQAQRLHEIEQKAETEYAAAHAKYSEEIEALQTERDGLQVEISHLQKALADLKARFA